MEAHVDDERIRSKTKQEADEEYFKSYGSVNVHREMVGDVLRTQTYRRAILRNYKYFYGKVVADVGAGTGILSVFAVQAGAKKVYAIEASPMAEKAKEVARSNGMEEKITVVQGKVEDVSLPEKVDVLISEWMGYMLLYESMLLSVIHARDTVLKEGGLILPRKSRLFLAPFSDPEEYEDSVEFWNSVESLYKVKMSPIAELAAKEFFGQVHIKFVDPITIQSHGVCFQEFDIYTVQSQELENVTGTFCCSCFGTNTIHGFVIWFDVEFCEEIQLTTSPYYMDTHWQQCVLNVSPFDVIQGTEINGTLSIKPNNSNYRCLSVSLEFTVNDKSYAYTYNMDGYS